jgi:hypothetical protein
LRVPLESLPELRRQPGPAPREPLPPAFLKHADEQTVAGLSAVLRAIEAGGLRGSFRAWGVLAAPRFLGRSAMAVALQRFVAEGAWGVSPHMIPHRSLHSVSGTVSQALKAHGPNFGVGGGPGGEAEGLLAAAALLHGQRLPGVWLVLTRLAPEAPLSAAGAPPPGTCCEAVALALRPACADWAGPRLRLKVGPAAPGPPFGLEVLADMLRRLGAGEAAQVRALGAGARVELVNLAARRAPEGPVVLPGPASGPVARRRSA